MRQEYVPSNASHVLHIRKEGWKMVCGQSFSNRHCYIEDIPVMYPKYRICSKCQKSIQEVYMEKIKAGSKIIIDGVNTLLTVDSDMELDYFIKKVSSIYGELIHGGNKEGGAYFFTTKQEEKADMRFLYEVKDDSGVTRKIAISEKSIQQAITAYIKTYNYGVESITYIDSIRML